MKTDIVWLRCMVPSGYPDDIGGTSGVDDTLGKSNLICVQVVEHICAP